MFKWEENRKRHPTTSTPPSASGIYLRMEQSIRALSTKNIVKGYLD